MCQRKGKFLYIAEGEDPEQKRTTTILYMKSIVQHIHGLNASHIAIGKGQRHGHTLKLARAS